MDEESDDRKEFDPSQRKLDEARQKGDVPRSADLTSAAAQGGLLLGLAAAGTWSASQIGIVLAGLLGDADRLADTVFRGGGTTFSGTALAAIAAALLPWFALPAGAAVLSLIAQQGLAASGEKIVPKLSRLDPIANARHKFGLTGLIEFGKSSVKLVVVSVALFLFLKTRLPEILASSGVPAPLGTAELVDILTSFLLLAVVIAGTIGLLDLLWQRFNHRRKLRMSRKELVDEQKQNDGDPHLKHQRRQRGYDIATNRMLLDVPKADVVIVNPEHYAVALTWERKPGRAPVCVAKGVDAVAARIREAALAASVPIQRDPPTARALYATVEIGREIAPEHYRAVAAAIRFAEDMRARARSVPR
jgi:flagellar biosynthetic protein FlhB